MELCAITPRLFCVFFRTVDGVSPVSIRRTVYIDATGRPGGLVVTLEHYIQTLVLEFEFHHRGEILIL